MVQPSYRGSASCRLPGNRPTRLDRLTGYAPGPLNAVLVKASGARGLRPISRTCRYPRGRRTQQRGRGRFYALNPSISNECRALERARCTGKSVPTTCATMEAVCLTLPEPDKTEINRVYCCLALRGKVRAMTTVVIVGSISIGRAADAKVQEQVQQTMGYASDFDIRVSETQRGFRHSRSWGSWSMPSITRPGRGTVRLHAGCAAEHRGRMATMHKVSSKAKACSLACFTNQASADLCPPHRLYRADGLGLHGARAHVEQDVIEPSS